MCIRDSPRGDRVLIARILDSCRCPGRCPGTDTSPRSRQARSWILVADGIPVGYGETWVDDDEREVELARIIVAPPARGRGLGRELTRLLVTEARRSYPDVVL